MNNNVLINVINETQWSNTSVTESIADPGKLSKKDNRRQILWP